MNKRNIKVVSIIISLLFISGGFVLAEEVSTTADVEVTGSSKVLPVGIQQRQELRDQMRTEIEDDQEANQEDRAQGMQQIKDLNQERQQNLDTFKNEVQKTLTDKGTSMQEEKDNIKAQVKLLSEKQKEIIAAIKTKRDEFKNQIEQNRETLKAKVEASRAILKTNLLQIKDEKKQGIVENISDRIIELNTRLTGQLSDRVDQIESVLAGIKSRMSKAEGAGLDVTAVKELITKVESDIDSARADIIIQSEKSYTIDITTEDALKADVTSVRDSFKADITATQDLVKKAHEDIVLTAKALAQIKGVDDVDVEVKTESTASEQETGIDTTNTVESDTTANIN